MPLPKIIRALLVSTGLLIVPFTASFFVDGWLWSGFDYVFAWVMFSFFSLGFTFVAGSTRDTTYKVAVGLAVAAVFLLIWINGAVQIIGDVGDLDSPNGIYLAVLVVGLFGAIFARLKPRGMSYTLFAMAVTQFSVPLIAYLFWSPSSYAWTPSIAGIFILNSFWVVLFTASGLLFRQAGDSALE